MAAYAQDFQSKSQGLLGYVQSQLSQVVGWSALPGQLNKIVASSGGYVWGFNAVGNFYMCKEPCDGTNWKQMANPPDMIGMPLDIAVDAQNVYVLFTGKVTKTTPAPAPSTSLPTFYPDYNYEGTGVPLGTGDYPFIRLMQSIRNDTVSSIRVPKGYTVTIYQDDIGSRSVTLTSDVADLRTIQFDNAISAIKITGGPITSGGSTYTDLGCWNDKAPRALTGPPQQYGYSVKKCADFALARGSDTFALQDGGWCVIKQGSDDYKKYGPATGACPELGGAWVNHVYQIPQTPAASTTTTSTNQLSFAIQPIDGSGRWNVQAIPGDVPANPQINITDQFIFVGNQGCSKPCTTSSWVAISAPQGAGQSMGVSAASSGSTYIPVNNAGKIKVYSGTGSGQGGWTEKPGLAGKIPVAVEADNQFMYAQDPGSGGIYRCGAPYTEDDSCKLADTQGKTVMGNHTISVNPRSYQTYIAAASSGPVGNLYQRLDEGSVNVAPLIEQTKKYTSGLDSDVNALGYATTAQAAALSAAHTREQALEAIEQITDLDDKFKETRIKQGNMRSKIINDKSALPTRIMALKVVAYTLVAVIILHIVLSFFLSPTLVMGISVVGTLIGLSVAYSYLGVGYKISFSSLN
jgi:hypothetical protein